MIKIMLVDDHRLVRAGPKRVLAEIADMEVVAEASTGEEALELARGNAPEVVLMDINMPGIGGLETTRRLKQRLPEVKIIVVSMHLEEPYPSRLLAAGASVSGKTNLDQFATGLVGTRSPYGAVRAAHRPDLKIAVSEKRRQEAGAIDGPDETELSTEVP